MPSYALEDTPWQNGTKVGAYFAMGYDNGFPGANPPGTPVEEVTASGFTVIFEKLEANVPYLIVGKVGSDWRTIRFTPDAKDPDSLHPTRGERGPRGEVTRAELEEFEDALFQTGALTASDFGIAGDGKTDDTEKFQGAFEELTGTGKTLLIPSGAYVLSDVLGDTNGFNVQGLGIFDWEGTTNYGSVFLLTGALESATEPVISIKRGGSVEGCVWHYPSQDFSKTTPTVAATGYVLRLDPTSPRKAGQITRNWFPSVSHAIRAEQGWETVTDNFICASDVAIRDDETSTEHHFPRNHISIGFGPAAQSPFGSNLGRYIAENGIAYDLRNCLGATFSGNTIFGYGRGLKFSGVGGYVSWTGGLMDACRYPIEFADGAGPITLKMSSVQLAASVAGGASGSRNDTATIDANCILVGDIAAECSVQAGDVAFSASTGHSIKVENATAAAPFNLATDDACVYSSMGAFSHTHTMVVTSVVGTFTPSVASNDGDKITGGSSGATAIVRKYESGVLYLDVYNESPTFTESETITGSKSGATAKVGAITKLGPAKVAEINDAGRGDYRLNGQVKYAGGRDTQGIHAIKAGQVETSLQFRAPAANPFECLKIEDVERFVDRGSSSVIPGSTHEDVALVGPFGKPPKLGPSSWSRSNPELGTVVAAATVTLPEGASFVEVTGTTGITSITASWAGRSVTLKFASTPKVTDGSNLKLAGNLEATADDTLSLKCDGTNWVETSRSVN